jgi:hypothetical protein
MLLVPILLLCPLVLCPFSQDKPIAQEKPASDPHATQLAHVLSDTAKKGSLHFTGNVAEHAAEKGDGGGAIMVGAGGSGTKFSGDLDAWRTAKNELFVLSKKRLPELALFDDGVQPIVRTTYGDENIDVSQAVGDLTALLDLAAMSKTVEALGSAANKPAIEWSGGPGEVQTVACELPTRFIKRGSGMAQMAMPKVLRIVARFTIDAKGALAAMTFDVVRSDPFGQIRRNALQGGGSSALVVNPSDLGNEEGPTSVYTLQVDTQTPDPRAESVLGSMRETAKSDAR